ncbi:uncharacterized protein LOC129581766 [Paramacrobiotus metropolitanus]|uniref:uncharacterized protein LOC129581766 n=1 Tax=Paramacrobiotus metropolitanus TaxID=2943436 RepID=UPI002445970F|nr:uncharacterized protein LOC129581766 [Paramacrobiotus metropolitanus]
MTDNETLTPTLTVNNGGCDWDTALGVNTTFENVENNSTIYVYLVLYPVLLFCCTVGSSLTIAALVKDPSSRRTSTAVYMICSACGNLCILWSALPDYITSAKSSLGIDENDDNSTSSADLLALLQYKGFGVFWNETSIQFVDWTLIVFSVERLLVTLRPLSAMARTASTAWQKTIIKELIVLLLACLFSLSWLCTYYYWLPLSATSLLTFQELLTPPLRRWYTVQNDAEVGMWIAKWLALSFLSAALIFVLWKHRKAISKSVAQKKDNRARNANLIVIGSLTLYMVTQLPYVLLTCLKIARSPPYCTLRMTNAQDSKARSVVNVVSWSNYSVSFFVYYLSSAKFREQVKSMFTGVRNGKQHRNKGGMHPTQSRVQLTMQTLSPKNSSSSDDTEIAVEKSEDDQIEEIKAMTEIDLRRRKSILQAASIHLSEEERTSEEISTMAEIDLRRRKSILQATTVHL